MATRQRNKTEAREKSRDKRPRAVASFIRIPSDKVEIVLDLIRGKTYAESAAILSNTGKSACEPVLKLLTSAAANAENNLNMPKDDLFVAECYATSGPTYKRMSARARGRADRILKKTCHITIILDEKKEKEDVGKAVKTPVQKKNATAKEVPTTQSERPLTNKPNSKKPLGVKKVTAVSGNKAGQAAKDAKTAKPAAKKETK